MRVESIPEPIPELPPVVEEEEAEVPTVDRQRRGALYVRLLAAAGIGLTILFLWRFLATL
jgi:hypothetical protein